MDSAKTQKIQLRNLYGNGTNNSSRIKIINHVTDSVETY